MTFTAADRPAICEQQPQLEPAARPAGGAGDLPLDNLHTLPVSELRTLLGRAREDRRRIRGQLTEFEDDFRASVGRKVGGSWGGGGLTAVVDI